MKRLLLTAMPLLLVNAAFSQPNPKTKGMGKNPPRAQVVPLPEFSQDTPENAVRFFFNALSDPYELQRRMAVAGARVGFYGADEWETMRRNVYPLNSLDLATLKIDNVKIKTLTENKVLATITAHYEHKGQMLGRRTPHVEDTLPLRLETNLVRPGFEPGQKAWRVVPLSVEEVLTNPLSQLPPLQLAATLARRDPRLLPYLRQQAGMNQLTQLALSALQFSQDFDEVFAFEDAAVQRAIRPYIKSDSVFTVPGTKDARFHFNDNLSAKDLAAIREPARTVLFYDGTARASDKLNFRFGGKTLIGYADGHVKAVTKGDLNDLIWKP